MIFHGDQISWGPKMTGAKMRLGIISVIAISWANKCHSNLNTFAAIVPSPTPAAPALQVNIKNVISVTLSLSSGCAPIRSASSTRNSIHCWTCKIFQKIKIISFWVLNICLLILSLVAHPLICLCAEVGILNFEYFVIFVTIFSQLLNPSLKLRKRQLYCSKFTCLANKKFIFSVKIKHKKNL